MPRQLRYGLVDIPQHVFQRGNNRQTIFFSDADHRHYLDCLREACARYECQVHAYALMTNHVHLLMTPLQPDAIAKIMQSVGRRYVRYINDVYQRTGTLWEGRYKASLVDPEHYLLMCYRYIELNPVRAGLVQCPSLYPWSSYGHHVGERRDFLVSDHAQYLALGQTPAARHAAYRDLFRAHIDPAVVSMICSTVNQCLVLGTERFKDRIEQEISRRVRHGKAGRPKKLIAL